MEAAQNIDFAEIPGTTQFGRYRLLESIGQGGMADVMVAVMPGPARFNKLVVIKTIREQMRSEDIQYAQMFLDEARLAARLNHPNVVHTYDVGDEKGVYYIAMEYLEGQALSQVQRKLGLNALPLGARLRILIDTAHGLHHAHELTDYSGAPLQVVHCDVSPQNIFLTYDGQVKLLDFGIAKMRDADAVSVAGHVKGKIDYMAPEQLKGELVDRTADVFALGAIMWELLAGKPMSGGRELSQITRVHNRLARRESAIRAVMPELDAELARICDKALSHAKSERYASALEFARDLQEYLTQRQLTPTPEQLSQILQPLFDDVRTRRRKRIEAALATVEREQNCSRLPEQALQDDSGPTLALGDRLRRNPDAQGVTETTGNTQARTHSTPIFLPNQTRPSTLQKVAIVAIVVGASAWLQLRSEAPASVPARVQRIESTTQAAVPMNRVAPVDVLAAADSTVKLAVNADSTGVDLDLRDELELQVAAQEAPPARRPRARHHTAVASRAVATSHSTARERASDELLPGQEMARQGRGAPEMSDEDPWQ